MNKLQLAVLATLGLIGCDEGETEAGPCLSIEQTDTESESGTETARSSDATRDDVRDRVLDRAVLPADVADRLRREA